MKTKLHTLLTITLFILVYATGKSQPVLQWDHTYNGTLASDRGNAIAVDDNGNVYVTGSSDGIGTNKDCIIIKYSAQGDTLWVRKFNGAANGVDEGFAIELDLNNNVYVTGRSQTIGFNYNILTIKYDSLGTKKWVAVFPGTKNNRDDTGYDLAVDQYENVYVGGRSDFKGITIKYNANGEKLWSSKGGSDTFIIKINKYDKPVVVKYGSVTGIIYELDPNNGAIEKSYYFPYIYGVHTANALQFDEIGNMYLVASLRKYGDNYEEVYLIKYTYGSSDYTWYTYWYVNSSDHTLIGVDMEVDAIDNVYILMGWHDGYDSQFYLVRRRPTGDSTWAVQYGTQIDEIPVSLSLGGDLAKPNLYVAGYTSTGNILSLKYDSKGNLKWDIAYDCGNNGADIATAMVQDAHENIYITGYSKCEGNNDDIKTIKYCVSAPKMPERIVGDSIVCLGESYTFTVPPDSNVVDYTWYLPDRWSGESSSNSITVTFENDAKSGQLSVIANGNQCSSASRAVSITIHEKPEQPTEIFGDLEVCSESARQYSIDPVTGADNYDWNLPDGWTGSSESETIDVVAGDQNGWLEVRAVNACGASEFQRLYVEVNMAPSLDYIIGPTELCHGDVVDYSVTEYDGATYSWTLPDGWSFGLPGNSIVAIAAESGEIIVEAEYRSCRAEPVSLDVTVLEEPEIPIISGPHVACANEIATFFVDPVEDNTEYVWFVPEDWQMIDSAGNGISVITGTTGTLEVIASNMCGTSQAQEFDVSVDELSPDLPSLHGPDAVCAGTFQRYMAESGNATTYDWIVPNGWTVLNGGTGPEMEVIVGSTDVSLGVRAKNACGFSGTAQMHISVSNLPDVYIDEIDGTLVANVAGASYQWLACGQFEEMPGDTARSFNPPMDGYYAVEVKDGGCRDTSECYYFMTVGIHTDYTPRSFDIYPNPTDGLIHLSGDLQEFEDIRVTNSLGHPICTVSHIPGETVEIDLSAQPAGVYLITARSGKTRLTKRIVKQ